MIRLLLTSGRGPAECRAALAGALGAMTREAEAAGLDMDAAPGADPDGWGPASAVVILRGAGAEAFAESWTGTILWTAQSPVRPLHRRKNWYVGVFRLPPPAEAAPALNPADVRIETFRAGGPGGQHQNTTDSAVRATHKPTGLTAIARGERSQHRNKALALARLAELLRLQGEAAALADRQVTQAGHDRLERGRPVRRFRGEDFRPG